MNPQPTPVAAAVGSDLPSTPTRRPRAKRLKGPNTTWRSTSAEYPKLHLDPDCKGLERVLLKEQVCFDSIGHLVSQALPGQSDHEGHTSRPCRACALESVLYTVLAPSPAKPARQVFVTFTSQPAPEDPGTRLHRYRWAAATPSGEQRLAKVAQRAGLHTTNSPAGLVAFGFVAITAIDALGPNLRTYVNTKVTQLPDPSVVETFWALENDNPAQFGAQSYDPWQTASLLVR